MRRARPFSPLLAATVGADVYRPEAGVEICEIVHYYDGPLAGVMCGPAGGMWVFECVHFDAGPRRVWWYAPLRAHTRVDAACAVLDELLDGPWPRPPHPLLGAATLAISEGPAITAALAFEPDADLKAVVAAAASGQLPIPGAVVVDDDVFVRSMARVRSEPEVLQTARRHLCEDPLSFVADPQAQSGNSPVPGACTT